MSRELDVICGPRRSGKTTSAIQWVLDGEKQDHWPYWTRVIVVQTLDRLESLRAEFFKDVEDFSHRCFCKEEWDHRAPHVRNNPVEVLYEEAQTYLPHDAVAVTMTVGDLEVLSVE